MSLPFFRRAGAQGQQRPSTSSALHHRSSLTPDFGAFDEDEDEDDEAPQHRPMLQNQQTDRSPSSHGPITLDSTMQDPLTSSLGRLSGAHDDLARGQGRALASSAATLATASTSLPGGYDFEPQGHEGAPIASIPRVHGSLSNPSGAQPPYDSNDALEDADARRQPSGHSGNNTLSSLAQRLLPQTLYSRLSQRDGGDNDNEASSGLLFSQDEPSSGPDDTDTDSRPPPSTNDSTRPSYPPRPAAGLPSYVPLPARAPQFAAPRATDGHSGTRVFGGGQNNDGVFANLSAKPDNTNSLGYVGGDDDEHKDEVLPAYEVAALDSTPPYWETTVITPGGTLGPDDICVDGLPVGNLFGFAWNLLVSMSFQFVGFLLTYLLHTTHAAKNGSRAGLGITMIQLGFYLKQRADHPELFELMPGDLSGLDGATGPQSDDPSNWSWWGGMAPPVEPDTSADAASSTLSALGSLPTQIHGALGGVLSASNPGAMRNSSQMPSLTGQMSEEELVRMSTAANEWMAFMMITLGSFLIVGAVLSYWRAVRWARAVRAGQGPQNDQESLIGRLLAS
ncbi:hypothetical protein ACM66B_000790 [Microbotryomycetes sp. NB124-2]